MIQINMLPWRERAREIKKKNFFVALAISIGLTFFVIFLFHMYYDDLISYQDKRNAFLKAEIAQKQKEINDLRKNKEQQAAIKTKLQFLMGLRDNSYRAVSLLSELLRIVPDTITLSKLARVKNTITIEGRAQSDLAITAFLKSISQVPIFIQPVLTGINAQQGKAGNPEIYFQIKMEQKVPIQEQEAMEEKKPLPSKTKKPGRIK